MSTKCSTYNTTVRSKSLEVCQENDTYLVWTKIDEHEIQVWVDHYLTKCCEWLWMWMSLFPMGQVGNFKRQNTVEEARDLTNRTWISAVLYISVIKRYETMACWRMSGSLREDGVALVRISHFFKEYEILTKDKDKRDCES